ncbi:hypothetical protein ACVQ8P_02615 [Dellaglioa sp. BT-FLS60]
MIKSVKVVTIMVAVMILGGAVAPSTVAFANNIKTDTVADSNSNRKSFSELYSGLSSEKKDEFQTLIEHSNLTKEQQYQLLQDRYNESNQITPKWKVALLKKAIKYAVKLLQIKISSKSLTDFVNYLTDFEGGLQKGLEKGLIKYVHINKTLAKWTARTVFFIFF